MIKTWGTGWILIPTWNLGKGLTNTSITINWQHAKVKIYRNTLKTGWHTDYPQSQIKVWQFLTLLLTSQISPSGLLPNYSYFKIPSRLLPFQDYTQCPDCSFLLLSNELGPSSTHWQVLMDTQTTPILSKFRTNSRLLPFYPSLRLIPD